MKNQYLQARLARAHLLALTAVSVVPSAYAGDITFSETISATLAGGSIDSAGIFGTPNANLSGDTITISFGYDYTAMLAAALSNVNGSNAASPYTNGVEEGFNDISFDGTQTVSATVGSSTYSLTDSSGFADQTWICNRGTCGGSTYQSWFHQNINNGSNEVIQAFFQSTVAAADLGTPSDMANWFNNVAGYGTLTLQNPSGSENLNFDNETVVGPEPGTWGLLAAGLGAAGMLRRRSGASR